MRVQNCKQAAEVTYVNLPVRTRAGKLLEHAPGKFFYHYATAIRWAQLRALNCAQTCPDYADRLQRARNVIRPVYKINSFVPITIEATVRSLLGPDAPYNMPNMPAECTCNHDTRYGQTFHQLQALCFSESGVMLRPRKLQLQAK